MSKIKVILLCLASAILGVGIGFAALGVNHKNSPTELVLNIPPSVQKGELIDAYAKVLNPSWFLESTVIQWKVLHQAGEMKFKQVSNDNIYIPSGITSDKIFIVCSAVNYKNFLLWSSVQPLDTKIGVVNVGDPVPPGPGPDPGPTPTPTPIVKDHLFAILIHDSNTDINLTPSQLALKNSQTIQARMKSLDTEWKVYDKANPALSDPSWQSKISKSGLPAIFIVNKDGKEFNDGNEKVVDENDIVKKIQDLRGTK